MSIEKMSKKTTTITQQNIIIIEDTDESTYSADKSSVCFFIAYN